VALPDDNQGMPRQPKPATIQAALTLTPEHVKALIAAAKLKFTEQSKALDNAVMVSDGFAVDTQENLEVAISNASAIKGFIKALDNERKSVIGGADAFVRGINGFVKMFKDKGDKAVSSYNRKASTYSAKIESERREREAAAAREAVKLQAEIDKKAKKEGFEPPTVMAPVEEKRDTVIRTESGASAYTRKKWTFEVFDYGKIPPEYLIPDTITKYINEPDSLTPTEKAHLNWYFKKIDQAIEAGIRDIPGVRIFQDSKLSIR